MEQTEIRRSKPAASSNTDRTLPEPASVRTGKGGQGMWRGVRSGGTWTFTQPASGAMKAPKTCNSIAFDLNQPGVAYAAVGTGTPGVDNENEVGLYKSSDDGLNWSKQTSFGTSNASVESVAISTVAATCFASRGGTFADRAFCDGRQTVVQVGCRSRRLCPESIPCE